MHEKRTSNNLRFAILAVEASGPKLGWLDQKFASLSGVTPGMKLRLGFAA